jgi:chromosome segregation ATPase
VTVKLTVNSLGSSDIRNGIKDYLTVSGQYFTQRVAITIAMKPPPASPKVALNLLNAQNLQAPAASQGTADNRIEQLMRRVEALSSQNSSLQSSLSSQAAENDHLRSLLSTVDSERSNVQSVVSEELARERKVFEERSAKVLVILNRRDETIQRLTDEVETIREDNANIKANAESQRLTSVAEVGRLQDRVIELSNRQRQSDINTLSAIQGNANVSQNIDLNTSHSALTQEYENKMRSHEEQIDVLSAEVNALRSEKQRGITGATEEVRVFRDENKRLAAACNELVDKNRVLSEQYDRQTQLHAQTVTTDTNQERAELITFDQTSKIIDMEVSIARLNAVIKEKDRAIQDCNAAVTAAREREDMAVSDYKALAEKVRSQADSNWESKYRKTAATLESLSTDHERITELYDTAKAVVAQTDARLQEALRIIDDKKTGRVRKGGENTWWRHVASSAKSAPKTSVNDVPQTAHPRTDSITHLGVTITTLRQQLLKAELTHRREKDELAEKLHGSQVRITTLESHLRTGRDSNSVRIRELESALRVVSGRSDLHSSLAASQQQLASERVKMVTVQGDLKLQVELLEEVRHQARQLSEQLSNQSDELDMMKVVKTLEGVPGVDPAEIIDGFVGQLEAKESELEDMKKTWKKKSIRRSNKENSDNHNNPASDHPDDHGGDSDDGSSSSDEETSAPATTPLTEISESRLAAQVEVLTNTISEQAKELVAEKQKVLEADRDKEALMAETSAAFKRNIAKLERKLTTTVAEATNLRSEITSLRNDKLSTEELVRQLNFSLETTKQQLSVQTELANTNVSFTNDDATPATDFEISRLQSLLDERTNNVSVLMSTIETLQTAISSSPRSSVGDDDATEATDPDDSIASGSILNGTSSTVRDFAHAALAKRVINLTAELSSATAVAAMMERRAEQMSLEVQQRSKYSNFLAAKLKLYEEENKKHSMRAGIVADEHKRLMNNFNRELSKTTNENNDLRRNMIATETCLKDNEIEVAALSSDIVVLEETVHGLRKKLREDHETSIASKNGHPASSPHVHLTPTPLVLSDQLRITSIVENFTDQLQQMRTSSKPHRRTKEQDNQIFSWIRFVVFKTDALLLVLARVWNDLQKDLRQTINERDSRDLSLEEAHQRESHLEKRLELCEKALNDRTSHKLTQTENSIAFMENRVKEVQDELVALSEKDLYICAEHRSTVQQLELAKARLSKSEQQRVSLASEVKLVSSKARVQAGLEIEEKLAESETKTRQWFESELAGLLSGSVGKGKSWNDYDKYDEELVTANETAASLAHALATSKQVQHTLEMKLSICLERCDSSSEQIGLLQQNLHDVVSASSSTPVQGERGEGSGNDSMSRLWELYSPTGAKVHTTVSASMGEPNPTFQNLLAEVDTLRAAVRDAEHRAATSLKEQERLNIWLTEARKDADNAQEQLGKRTNAIRSELEKRHMREVTLLQQQREEQHSAQISALGQLRNELLNKETALNEAKLRLQLFGDNGSDAVHVNNLNTGEISFHPPIVQQNALQQERDYLLQKNDSMVEELRVCSSEKYDLENECERLVGAAASYQAEATNIGEELSIHRNALRALEESVGGAVQASSRASVSSGSSVSDQGEISPAMLARSLASAKLAEASAMQKLQKSAQNEATMRIKAEEKEREIKELRRLLNGEGKGDGAKFTDGKAVDPESRSPWAEENVTKLRQRVSTQASAIAYLELKIAQLMAEQSVAVGDSGIQNLRRELAEVHEEKARTQSELEAVREQMQVRGKLALSTLDSNTTRIEGDREVERLTKLDAERQARAMEMEQEVGELREVTYDATSEKENLVLVLNEKISEVASLKKAMQAAKKEHNTLFSELREASDKLLKFGGGRVKDYAKEGSAQVDFQLDVERLKSKPLFVAASKLHDEMTGWLEQWQGGVSLSDVVSWDDLWELTKVANETRELAAVAEELPLSLQLGMSELRERVLDLHSEMDEREERVAEVAENAVREKSVEAIQQLRAQVMLLKKRAEDGDMYKKEVAAENEILKRESTKHHEELVSMKALLMKKKVESEEELKSLRAELMNLKKSSWEQTSTLRTKYDGALNDVEASAERQISLANQEVERLQQLLKESSEKGRIGQLAFGSYLQTGEVAQPVQPEVQQTTRPPLPPAPHSLDDFADSDEGLRQTKKVKELQALLDKAANEAKKSSLALRDMETQMFKNSEKHDAQVVTLREQFGRYREAQDKLVAGLNSQLRELKTSLGGGGKVPFSRSMARMKKEGSSDNEELMVVLAQKEAFIVSLEQKIKKLAYEYKVKVEEAEAARKTAHEVTGDADNLVGASVVERAILEAKGGVLEVELRKVMGDLTKEKQDSAELRRELAASVLQVAAVRGSGAGAAGQPKVQAVLKQMAELKRKAKIEISTLQAQLMKQKDLKDNVGDVVAIRQKMESMSAALQLAREDLSRKNKIVLNLKNSRAADEKAVMQWKQEVEALEEKLNKATRELTRREGLLASMKQKQTNFEGGEERGGKRAPDDSGDGGDGGGDKLRELNLERNRFRQQVTILKSKVAAQAEEIELLQSEKDRVKGLESKVVLLKASLGRKDSILSALKSQVTAAEDEFKLYKTSADENAAQAARKIKDLSVRIKEGEGERREEESMRVQMLEEKKESLASELAGIKGSMYQIMGELYTANQKARGSPAVGSMATPSAPTAGSKLMEKLDAGRLEQISSMLDLSANELQDIFDVGTGGAGTSVGDAGPGAEENERDQFMGTLEDALDLSGERSVVDIQSVMELGKNLVSKITQARDDLGI